MNGRRRRIVSLLAVSAVILGAGCKRTGDPVLDEFLCEVFGVVFEDEVYAALEGHPFTADAYYVRGNRCTTPGTFTAMGSVPGAFDIGGVTYDMIPSNERPDGVPAPRNSDEAVYRARIPITMQMGGSFSLSLRYEHTEANVIATHTAAVNSQATRGAVNVTITGLPANTPGNVVVDVLGPSETQFTQTGSGKFFAGTIGYQAQPVTSGDGITYAPNPASGTFDLGVGETHQLTVNYTAETTMGMVNLGVMGLPDGLNGSVTVTGENFNQTFNASSWIPLQAGIYTFTSNTVGNAVNDYNDPEPTRQVSVTAGQVTNVLYTYAIIATLVNIQVLGLEAGLGGLATLTKGSDVRTVSGNTAALKLALGIWTINMVARTINGREYIATGSTPTSINVVAQTTAMALALTYFCHRFQWQIAATFGLFSDVYNHFVFVQLALGIHLLNILWQIPDPAPALPPPGITIANQTSQQTVTISGPTNFVTVTGTRAANGALNLTGTGTVAGFPNVPVTLTGTMTNAGALTNVQYQMGQNTPPTGLPNGPIIFSITADAPPQPPPLLMGIFKQQ